MELDVAGGRSAADDRCVVEDPGNLPRFHRHFHPPSDPAIAASQSRTARRHQFFNRPVYTEALEPVARALSVCTFERWRGFNDSVLANSSDRLYPTVDSMTHAPYSVAYTVSTAGNPPLIDDVQYRSFRTRRTPFTITRLTNTETHEIQEEAARTSSESSIVIDDVPWRITEENALLVGLRTHGFLRWYNNL